MKNNILKFLCLFTTLFLLIQSNVIFASAINGNCIIDCGTSNTFTKGSTIQANITFAAHKDDNEIWSVDGELHYNPSVLSFQSSTAVAEDKNGVITFSIAGTGQSKTSVTFKFSAKATGKSDISIENAFYYSNDGYKISDAALVVTVADKSTSSKVPASSSTPTISKNANLSSLRVKDHELSPAFSASTTSYTVTARYPVEQVTIFASTEHSEATYVGAGTYDLKVGDNERIVTVTAQDGKTKKSYFVTIKRLTQQETADYDAQNEVKDPLGIQLEGVPHHIAADLSAITAPTGFTATTADYKGTAVSVFENADKTYTLYWLTNDETKQGDFYTYDFVNDTFTPLPYILVNGNVYILAKLPQTYTVPAGYSIVSMPLGNISTTAFVADEPRLKDFYMLYLHYDGLTQFYRFDQAETTLQRAPYFELTQDTPADTTPAPGDLLAQFNALSQTEKVLVYALAGALVLIIVLLIVIIVLVNRKGKQNAPDEMELEEEDLAPFIDLQNAALEEDLVKNEVESAPQEAEDADGESQEQNDESEDSEQW